MPSLLSTNAIARPACARAALRGARGAAASARAPAQKSARLAVVMSATEGALHSLYRGITFKSLRWGLAEPREGDANLLLLRIAGRPKRIIRTAAAYRVDQCCRRDAPACVVAMMVICV